MTAAAADATTTTTQDAGGDEAALHAVEATLTALKRSSLTPHDGIFRFVTSTARTRPMVMLLGNHSCGKSTLINYLAGRDIQATGVAPTDDGFTVIERGDYDMNEDGPTAVGQTAHGFAELQQYGEAFVSRFRVKTRRMPAQSRVPRDLLLVDTPGMIDTPVHVASRTSFAGQMRGYDFLAVTAWFARRSDVVLLMFDPANPGTTGETLDVLTRSLAGVEHKLLLVLNKVDMFTRATDFARTYGTLCWNLSKIVPIKDIPPIYTTCTPVLEMSSGRHSSSNSSARGDEYKDDDKAVAQQDDDTSRATVKTQTTTTPPSSPPTSSSPTTAASAASASVAASAAAAAVIPREEFYQHLDDVIDIILSASLSHLDNLITATEESTRCLLQASRVCAQLHRLRTRSMLQHYGAVAAACTAAAAAVAYTCATWSLPSLAAAAVVVAAAVGAVGVTVSRSALRRTSDELLARIDVVFEQLYGGHEKTTADELRWRNVVRQRVLHIAGNATARGNDGIAALPCVRARHCRQMEYVLQTELPALRATASARRHAECQQRSSRRRHSSATR